jgi:rare lipoprotein A
LSAACARTERGRDPQAGLRGTFASPRVIPPGHPIPKGGGIYKVGSPYRIDGLLYTPAENPAYDRTGIASFYGEDFHGRKTANGEIFDMWALTAAHPTLPMPSYAYVTNLANGRTLLVRINDRGPFSRSREIDLSRASARLLGFEMQGTAVVRVRYAGRAPLNGDDHHEQRFLAAQHWYRVAAWAGARAPIGR